MQLVKFSSWPEVMAYAKAGRPLYYQAPMDQRATRFLPGSKQTFAYSAQGRTIRLWPGGSIGRGKSRTHDPFNADSKHLDRFSHPAEQRVESSGVRGRRVMSPRQPSLPGFPDIPEKLEIKIPKMPMWEQIGGDMNPGAHGGILARSDGDAIELLEIQPVRAYVGDEEAADVGFPFWTKTGYYDLSDLDPNDKDVKSALSSSGFEDGDQKIWFEEKATPEQRAIAIAEALLSYGVKTDEGDSGWSGDVIHDQVKWMDGTVAGSEYIEDEDESFKDDVLGHDDIRSNLEAEVQKMVDESAAQGWSQLDDQTMIDLDEQGYDDQSAFVIGVFGNEPMIAVNTDTTFGADFAREIGVPSSKNNIYIWSETGTRELEKWLEKNGYEVVHRMGGDVPSTEAFATARFVIEAVAREMDLDESVVEEAAKGIDWWPKDRGQGDQEIPGSSDGETTVWAKRKEGEGVDESRRRRATRTTRTSARRRN